MPTRGQALDRNQLAMERAETVAARQVATAYNQARRELVARLVERWTATGTMRPDEAVRLLHSLGVLREVDARLLALEREVGVVLRDVIDAGTERAVEAVGRELMALPPSLRPDLSAFTRLNTAMLEQFLPLALDEAGLATRTLGGTLRREMQAGLSQGEGFPALVRRLTATTEPSVWRNGTASADRMVRRLVVHAENAARVAQLDQVQAQLPEVRKQVVASIGSRTTRTCLRAHGQIVDTGERFDLQSHEPQFARYMMHTPFHWNCRSAIAMWHPRFEAGGLTTANMRASAQAELRKR